jgi:hypothetical protein
MIEKALRLRKQRLGREIDDIYFLKMENSLEEHYQMTLSLSLRARQLIELELQRK